MGSDGERFLPSGRIRLLVDFSLLRSDDMLFFGCGFATNAHLCYTPGIGQLDSCPFYSVPTLTDTTVVVRV